MSVDRIKRQEAKAEALRTYQVSEQEAETISEDNGFVFLCGSHDELHTAITECHQDLGHPETSKAIQSKGTELVLTLSQLKHMRAQQILDRSIDLKEEHKVGETDE
jgi:hypothetical protein